MAGKKSGGDKVKRELMKKRNPRENKHGGAQAKTRRNTKGQPKFNSNPTSRKPYGTET